MSNIYLGADGGYHDDTEENRDRFPAAEDTPADTEAGTLTDAGEQPAEPTARTATKSSTK